MLEALNRMEEMRFVGMEFFGNRPADTHEASIDQVDLCELFVGIIGHRYGSGITEAEYRRARELRLPCFIYFMRDGAASAAHTDDDAARAARLSEFKRELMRAHTVKEVGGPGELAASATADLHNWVAARWVSLERAAAVPPARAAVTDVDRANIRRLLDRVEQDWIKGVLEASLHHRVRLELGLDWREDAVLHPWDRIVVAPDRPIRTLGDKESITGVFQAAQSTLLVLGEPGAGKTTTVLELARDLIGRARDSAAEPAPVVLALSTWRGEQARMADWIVAELGSRYQVPRRVALDWLENGRLVLVLDGLDEVAEERRAACVAAINAFEERFHPPGLAVTCRVAEYGALPAKLRLRSAICLQPLTAEQVRAYFRAAGPRLDSLNAALEQDEALRELARSPLLLSVMTMAWRDVPAGTAAPFMGRQRPEEVRRRLFGAYVTAMLNRRGKTGLAHSPERTEEWLAWLAQRMRENGLTLFALEHLQPSWLPGPRSQAGYMMLTRLLGVAGLLPPLLLWPMTAPASLACLVLVVVTGFAFGAVDFGFLRSPGAAANRGSRRFWTLLGTFVAIGGAWLVASRMVGLPDKEAGSLSTRGVLFLVMVIFAFCSAVDVRSLEIKPSDTLRWSWRLAVKRFGVGLVGVNVLVALAFLGVVVAFSVSDGVAATGGSLLGTEFYLGLALGVVAAAPVARRLWRSSRTFAVFAAVATVSLLVQLCGIAWHGSETGAVLMLILVAVAMFVGVFGGFVSGMVNPERGRRSGIWFWMRVPLAAFALGFGLMLIPGGVVLAESAKDPTVWTRVVGPALTVALGSGLVAFLRFGGFNGLQHGVLRWLLRRSGDLPPRVEEFLDQAANMALLQKVGFGYRFVHALLLDYFAGSRRGYAYALDLAPPRGPARNRVGDRPQVHARLHPPVAERRHGRADGRQLRLPRAGRARAAARHELRDLDRHRRGRHRHRGHDPVQGTRHRGARGLHRADRGRHRRAEADRVRARRGGTARVRRGAALNGDGP